MSRIISFRGLIESGGQDTIPLQTNNGLIGYRITKFQLMGQKPGAEPMEHVVKIYKTDQTGNINATIDFSDNRLLAAAYMQDNIGEHYVSSIDVVFDNEKFNQDIYVTCFDVKSEVYPINYYFELEQMKLDLSEQTVATLKDIRNVGAE
tara:strand:- start:22 stop:468 length:447 start_codon:yes stop_codon:yes gene_type:complete